MVSLAQKVRFLSQPAAYGGATHHVEAKETHMAWVFLTDNQAFKLKKPVKYPFLDFSTLEKRRLICEEELRLNSRLAAQTYQGVQPLFCDPSGQLSFEDKGRIVEWLVVMKRLPDDAMLEQRIHDHRLTHKDVERIAGVLCAFYEASPPQIASGDAYLRHLAEADRNNRTLLQRPEFDLASQAAGPLDRMERAFQNLRPEIENRIRRGRIIEGHGDLRPEHIFLVQPLQIIDCLEFNASMRIIDPYDEVSYLGLECEIHGADWVRPALLTSLTEGLGHPPSKELLAFYGTFRALLRARISLAHLLESPVRQAEKWKPLAKRYLAIAERESVNLQSRGNRKSAPARSDA